MKEDNSILKYNFFMEDRSIYFDISSKDKNLLYTLSHSASLVRFIFRKQLKLLQQKKPNHSYGRAYDHQHRGYYDKSLNQEDHRCIAKKSRIKNGALRNTSNKRIL